MKTVLQGTSSLFLLICLLFTQCSKTPDTPVTPKSSAKTLTSPTIDGISGASSSFDAASSTYTITVPYGINITALKMVFTLPTGASAKPASGSVQNFTNPVTYTVTAEDGSTQTYVIKLTAAALPRSSAKQITEFKFADISPVVSATIDQTILKITATLPATADLTRLVPTISISAKATVLPASGVAQNFSNPVNYTVTAEDGTTQIYEVKVGKVNASAVGLVMMISTGGKQGYNNTFILKADNSLWATGLNDSGQLGDGTLINKSTPVKIMTDVKTMSAGGRHSLIIKNDNSLWAVGGNFAGELGDGTKINKSVPFKRECSLNCVSRV